MKNVIKENIKNVLKTLGIEVRRIQNIEHNFLLVGEFFNNKFSSGKSQYLIFKKRS